MTDDPKLTLFQYEVLGLIGRQGAGPHDLRRMVDRGRILAWAGESQYYSAPKRLAELGYLDARREPGRTGERTVYSLTEKGLHALEAWAGTPASFTPIKSEALTRMLIADLVGEPATVAGVTAMREDISDLEARISEMRAAAESIPHRRKYLLLATDLLQSMLDAHLEWIDRVERELGSRS